MSNIEIISGHTWSARPHFVYVRYAMACGVLLQIIIGSGGALRGQWLKELG